MSRSSLQFADLHKLPNNDTTSMYLRLATPVNHAHAANTFFEIAGSNSLECGGSTLESDVLRGLRGYAVRLQISVLAEVLKLSKPRDGEFKPPSKENYSSDKAFGLLYWLCALGADQQIHSDLSEYWIQLQSCMMDFSTTPPTLGANYEKFRRYVTVVRDKLTFHYDPGILCLPPAMNQADCYKMRKSSRPGHSRFSFVDDLQAEHIRDTWKDPKGGQSSNTERTDTEDWVYELTKAFAFVGSDLCWNYFRA